LKHSHEKHSVHSVRRLCNKVVFYDCVLHQERKSFISLVCHQRNLIVCIVKIGSTSRVVETCFVQYILLICRANKKPKINAQP